MNKPKYITELEYRFESMEDRQRELRETWDKFLEREATDKRQLNEIYVLLCGSKLNKDNGGMISEFGKIKDAVKKNTNWRIKMTAAVSAVAGLFGFLIARSSVIIENLKELIKH